MWKVGPVLALLVLSPLLCYLPSLPHPVSLPLVLQGPKSSVPRPPPCLTNCSWERWLANEDFKQKVAYKRPFELLDDEEVREIEGDLACVPFSFGYSKARAELLFPPAQYPPCSALAQEPLPELRLSQANRTLTMTCPANFTPFYTLNPTEVRETDQWLLSDLAPLWQSTVYPGSQVSNVSSEFVLGKCDSKGLNAALEPRKNHKAASRAREIMRKLGAAKPVTVILLTLDSFSRRHFYRKLPETVSLLSRVNREDNFTIFDYKLHNVAEMGSAGNMLQILANSSHFLGLPDEVIDEKMYGRLWMLMKAAGFVTMFGFEDCDHHMVNALGRKLEVDHLVRTFYCGVRHFTGLNTAQSSTEQRCIGRAMSHTYLLNYTRKWMDMYVGLNQFIYLHVDTGHEYTGQHAATLDSDLAVFHQSLFAENTQDLFLLLHGDHGMGFGPSFGLLEAGQEHKLPVLFLAASNRLLDAIPGAYDSLWHNSYRLVSKRDIRATLLALSHLPYPQSPYSRSEENYLKEAVVLFSEKVPDTRSCMTIEIEGWCSCPDQAQEVPDPIPQPLTHLLHFIASEALEIANRQVYTPTLEPPGLLCLRLTLRSITKAFTFKVGEVLRLQIEMQVWESNTATFETFAVVTRKEEKVNGHKFVGKKERVVVGGEVMYMRIFSITRRDKYAGLCEDISRPRGLPADLCICNFLPSHPSPRAI